jgi:hypothetical protein
MLPLPLSLEAKAAGVLLAVAGLLGAVAWAAHHERQIGAAKCEADVAAATAEATNAARTEESRRAMRLQENTDAAYLKQRQAEADARSLRASRDGLLNAAESAGNRACNTAAAPDGAAASSAAVVPTDLFRSIEQRAEQLAGAADSARISGQLCESAYDALIKK